MITLGNAEKKIEHKHATCQVKSSIVELNALPGKRKLITAFPFINIIAAKRDGNCKAKLAAV